MQNIGLLSAISAKLDYLNRSQEIIAQNVANADTPGYRPRDLTPVDFGALMGQTAASGKLTLARTNGDHLVQGGVKPGDTKKTMQKTTYEVAPIGNAVVMEEQLVKASKVSMDYNLMLNVYRKNVNLLRIAMGEQGR